MKTRHLTPSVFFLIIISGVFNIVAQILLKKGLLETGISHVTSANIIEFITWNAASIFIWSGIIVYSLNFFTWIAILYKADLSIAMPAGSITYLFIPLMAVLFFHEHIGLTRWIGIALIVSGIFFVSKSRPAP